MISKLVITDAYMKILSLQNSTPSNLHPEAFSAGFIQIYKVSSFHLCCLPSIISKCVSKAHWYMNCGTLLPQKVKYLIVTVILICFNTMSLITHYLVKRQHTSTFRAIKTSMIFNNFLCIFYLCFLGTANIVYKYDYILKDIVWRSSPACFTAFGSMLSFIVLSLLLQLLLSTSRLMVVMNPINSSFKRYGFVLKCLFLTFVIILITTFSITLGIKNENSMISFKLCYPFLDPSKSVHIIHNLIMVISCGKVCCLCLVFIQHTLLVNGLKKSIEKMKKSVSSEQALIKQLSLEKVALTLSWLPQTVLHLTMLIMPKYPIDLIFWAVLVVIPITSHITHCVSLAKDIKHMLGRFKRT